MFVFQQDELGSPDENTRVRDTIAEHRLNSNNDSLFYYKEY